MYTLLFREALYAPCGEGCFFRIEMEASEKTLRLSFPSAVWTGYIYILKKKKGVGTPLFFSVLKMC